MVNKLEKCLHPMLAKRDQKWFCHKIQAEMQKQGLGYLILQAPYNVFYATGYTSLVGSSAAVIPRRGGCPPPDQHPGERRRLRIHAGCGRAGIYVLGIH